MVGANESDYRHSTEPELLAGLRAGHPLALAEAYHRTVAGVHAAARRLLGSPRDVEDLLTSLYGQLWTEPPQEPPLEGWLRQRSFSLGSAQLRGRGAAPASASLAPLLPDLPRPSVGSDALERELAELDDNERRALTAAFDQGQASLHQDQAGAPAALDLALRTLAGSDPPGDEAQAWSSPCRDIEGLADWTLGLLGREQGEAIGTAVAERADCHARARRLRRGRRRLEGLPPPPDVGQRIIARVLASGVAAGPASAVASVNPAGAAVPASQHEQAVQADPAGGPPTTSPSHPAPHTGAAPVPEPGGAAPFTGPGSTTPSEPQTTAAAGESFHGPPGDLPPGPTTPTEASPGPTTPTEALPTEATRPAPTEAAPTEAVPTDPPSSEPLQPPSAQPGGASYADGAPSAPSRTFLRRVVGVLVVLLVLGLGASVGLAIGLVIVGGL